MTMKKKKSHCSTPELIVQKSLEMFNLHGERQVTTNHIAHQLELSTGNLYYHYGSKEEIIIELIKQYIGKFNALMCTLLGSDTTFDNFIILMEKLIALRWEYRFIINSKFGAFLYNAKLKSAYFNREKDDLEVNKNRLFYVLREGGILKRGIDVTLLANQFSLLLDAWVNMQVGCEEIVSPQVVVRNGCNYMLMFIRPSVECEWADKISALLQRNERRTVELQIRV